MLCKFCNKDFKNVKNHEKHCKLNPNYDKIDHLYLAKNGSNTYKKLNELRTQKYNESLHEHILVCKKCGNEYKLTISDKNFLNGKYKQYCSRSCANSRIHTQETKNKISNSLKHDDERICACCGKKYKSLTLSKFCSEDCKKLQAKKHYKNLSDETRLKLSNAGKHSAYIQSNNRRSKNEILFCTLCEQHFTNVEHNKPIFNGWDADVIIHDIKYAILWNGPWHYKLITKKHSVQEIQNRDNIKCLEIIKYGYTPYIIKDLGKFNEHFVNDLFEHFIKNIENN